MWKILLVCLAVSAAQGLEDLMPVVGPSKAQSLNPKNTPADRIVGGEEATPGQFPHQVGIWITLRTNHTAFCGGAIVSSRAILTAAHCAWPGQHFRVVVGAHEIKKEEPTQASFVTSRKLVHENYDPVDMLNDIALLFLDEEISFNDRVQPVRLPSRETAKKSLWRTQVTTSGWGHLHTHDDTEVAPTLHYIKSRVLTNFYCKILYLFQGVHDSNICISGWWAKGTCQGDSGGPLVMYEADGKPTLVGLTSYGFVFGCELSWPSVFTRVSSHLDWIERALQRA